MDSLAVYFLPAFLKIYENIQSHFLKNAILLFPVHFINIFGSYKYKNFKIK